MVGPTFQRLLFLSFSAPLSPPPLPLSLSVNRRRLRAAGKEPRPAVGGGGGGCGRRARSRGRGVLDVGVALGRLRWQRRQRGRGRRDVERDGGRILLPTVQALMMSSCGPATPGAYTASRKPDFRLLIGVLTRADNYELRHLLRMVYDL
uniref:Uncharacterized protein OSJNBa0091F23.36 n=2 Tax=Oryza sativa subsp. japonica TaxID=39947 RepID=Q6YRL5_ORYSJ|nr:hypothetical protein [Oryza sativa Japonica Group]BAD10809.1 hypothetical protein [Oryza sativa Japonica Group]